MHEIPRANTVEKVLCEFLKMDDMSRVCVLGFVQGLMATRSVEATDDNTGQPKKKPA